jgi:hypothetical protein
VPPEDIIRSIPVGKSSNNPNLGVDAGRSLWSSNSLHIFIKNLVQKCLIVYNLKAFFVFI